MKQEVGFKQAYAIFPAPAYMLPFSRCIIRLITVSLVTVVFGNFSAFQPVQKADRPEPSGIMSLTVVTLTKIPHTSHMA